MYQLEERILFDGAAAVDLAVAQQEQQAQDTQAQADAQAQAQTDAAAAGDQTQVQNPHGTAPVIPADTSSAVPTSDTASTDHSSASLSAPIDASNPSQTTADTHHVNILVVSDSIENADELFKSANSETVVVRYSEKNTTGAELLQEITDALHGEKADSIGFVTDKAHDGAVSIFSDGDTSEKTLSTETQQKFWNGVEGLLAEKGKVNIFASDLASTETGRHLVDSLSQITNHQVAASTDVTGDGDAGGDWELEYVAKGAGSVDLIEEYFNRDAIQSFDHRIEKPTEIAFVDSSVRDVDTILKGIGDQAEIVYLNKDHAFEQITSYLQGRTDVDAVHLVSEGTSGEFYLGNDTVNSDFIASHQTELAAWGNAMSSDGDIMIYGCNLAKDQVGKDLVNQISVITGTDVAASTDRTGYAGDWNLEFTTGEIQTAGFIIGDYLHNLQTYKVVRLDDEKVNNVSNVNNLTLREAIYLAVDGDNIIFAAQATDTTILLVDTLVIDKNITIDGTILVGAASYSVTIDANDSDPLTPRFRALYIDTPVLEVVDPVTGLITNFVVDIRNMNFINGLSSTASSAPSPGAGGGILITNQSYVDMTNIQVTGSSARFGGGIYNAGTLNLDSNLNISYNTASNSGGGIYNEGTLTYIGDAGLMSGINGNTATTGHGGGIYNSGSMKIDTSSGASSFIVGIGINPAAGGNFAGASGGGIYSNTGDIVLTGVSLNGNQAGQDGGGIYIYANYQQTDPVTLTDIVANYNTAVRNGGAFYFTNGNSSSASTNVLTLAGGNFDHNIALNGGGIYIADSTGSITLSDIVVSSNTVTGSGGGVYMVNATGNISLSNVEMSSNIAAVDGGGAYITNAIGSITLSTNTLSSALSNIKMSSNTATTGDGGGVYIANSVGNITLSNIEMHSNKATLGNGGALCLENNSGSISIKTVVPAPGNVQSEFLYNFAGGNGGAIYIENCASTTSLLVMDFVNMSGNGVNGVSLTHNGGAIYIANSSGNITLSDMEMSSNKVSVYGGGIYISNASLVNLKITTSNLSYNEAARGGGIYLVQGTLTMENCTLAYNGTDQNTSGGAIYMGYGTLNISLSTMAYNKGTGAAIYIYGDSLNKSNLTVGNTIVYNLDSEFTAATPTIKSQIYIPVLAERGTMNFIATNNIYSHYYKDISYSLNSLNNLGNVNANRLIGYDSAAVAGHEGDKSKAIQSNLWLDETLRYHANYRTMALAILSQNSWAIGKGTAGGYDQRGNTRGTTWTWNQTTQAWTKGAGYTIGAFEPIFHVVVTSKGDDSNLAQIGDINAQYFANASLGSGLTLRESAYWIDTRSALDSSTSTRYVDPTGGTNNFTVDDYNSRYIEFSSTVFSANNLSNIIQLNYGAIRVDGNYWGTTTTVHDINAYRDIAVAYLVRDTDNSGNIKYHDDTLRAHDNPGRITVAAGTGGLFSISSPSLAAINNLTLSGGTATRGGGIYNLGGTSAERTTTLTNVIVQNCTASSTLDTSYGGGIYNTGFMNVYDSSIINNTVSALYGVRGGGIWNSGTMNMDRTQVNGNKVSNTSARASTDSGSIFVEGGGIYNSGSMLVERSEISGNMLSGASDIVHDIYMLGGGIYNSSANFRIANSTIAENKIAGVSGTTWNSYGSGIYIYSAGNLYSYYNTIANNQITGITSVAAESLAGLYHANIAASSLVMSNSIIAENFTPSWQRSDIYVKGSTSVNVASSDYNIVGAYNTSAYDWKVKSNTVGNQLLGSQYGIVSNLGIDFKSGLQYNGALTRTYRVLDGSVALDSGEVVVKPAGFSVFGFGTDQRGVNRGLTNVDTNRGAFDHLDIITVRSAFDSKTPRTGFDFVNYKPLWDSSTLTLREAVMIADDGSDIAFKDTWQKNGTVYVDPTPILTGRINNADGYAIGTTIVNVDNFSRTVAVGTYITIGTDPNYHRVTSTTATSITFSTALVVAVGDTAVISDFNAVTVANELDQTSKNLVINLTGGELKVIRSSVTINGMFGWNEVNTTGTVTASHTGSIAQLTVGTGLSNRIFNVDSSISNWLSTVSISNFTMSGGNVTGNGGGIFSAANLTLDNVTIQSCTAKAGVANNNGYGGGIYSAEGSLIVLNSVIGGKTATLGNTAVMGGGIFSASYTTEGSYALDLSKSSILNNIAKNSTSVRGEGGGIYLQSGEARIEYSTIAMNKAVSDGGGVYVATTGDLKMTNSTIFNNTAGRSGGGISFYSNSNLNLDFVTIANNQSGWTVTGIASGNPYAFGGGIYMNSGALALSNSILAQNFRGSAIVTSPVRTDLYTKAVINNISYSVYGVTGGPGTISPVGSFQVPDADWAGFKTRLDGKLTDNGGRTLTVYVFDNNYFKVANNLNTVGFDQTHLEDFTTGINTTNRLTAGAYENSVNKTLYYVSGNIGKGRDGGSIWTSANNPVLTEADGVLNATNTIFAFDNSKIASPDGKAILNNNWTINSPDWIGNNYSWIELRNSAVFTVAAGTTAATDVALNGLISVRDSSTLVLQTTALTNTKLFVEHTAASNTNVFYGQNPAGGTALSVGAIQTVFTVSINPNTKVSATTEYDNLYLYGIDKVGTVATPLYTKNATGALHVNGNLIVGDASDNVKLNVLAATATNFGDLLVLGSAVNNFGQIAVSRDMTVTGIAATPEIAATPTAIDSGGTITVTRDLKFTDVSVNTQKAVTIGGNLSMTDVSILGAASNNITTMTTSGNVNLDGNVNLQNVTVTCGSGKVLTLGGNAANETNLSGSASIGSASSTVKLVEANIMASGTGNYVISKGLDVTNAPAWADGKVIRVVDSSLLVGSSLSINIGAQTLTLKDTETSSTATALILGIGSGNGGDRLSVDTLSRLEFVTTGTVTSVVTTPSENIIGTLALSGKINLDNSVFLATVINTATLELGGTITIMKDVGAGPVNANISMANGLNLVGNITINSTVTGDVSITSTEGSVIIGSDVTAGSKYTGNGKNLTVNAALDASVGNITSVKDLTVTAGGNIHLLNSITVTGNVNFDSSSGEVKVHLAYTSTARTEASITPIIVTAGAAGTITTTGAGYSTFGSDCSELQLSAAGTSLLPNNLNTVNLNRSFTLLKGTYTSENITLTGATASFIIKAPLTVTGNIDIQGNGKLENSLALVVSGDIKLAGGLTTSILNNLATGTISAGSITLLDPAPFAGDINNIGGSVTGAINNPGLIYPVGTTKINVDNFTGAIAVGSYITIAGDTDASGNLISHQVISTVGGATPTSITFSIPLAKTVADDATITRVINTGVTTISVTGFTGPIQVGSFITIAGDAYPHRVMSVVGGSTPTSIVLSEGLKVPVAANAHITGYAPPASLTNAGTITVTGNVSLVGGNLTNSKNFTALSITNTFAGDLTNSNFGNLTNSGIAVAGVGGMKVTNDITLDFTFAGGFLNNTGTLTAGGAVKLTGTGALNNNTGSMTADTLTMANGIFTNKATFTTISDTGIEFTGTGSINNSLTLTTNLMSFKGGTLTNSGTIAGNGAAFINISGMSGFTNSGKMEKVNDIIFDTLGSLTNSGTLTVAGDITFAGGSLNNLAAGTLSANNFITLTGSGALINAGKMINANTFITLQDSSSLTNTQTMTVNSIVSYGTGSLNNNLGTLTADYIELTTGTLTNKAILNPNTINFTDAGNLVNNGTIKGFVKNTVASNITLLGGNLTNTVSLTIDNIYMVEDQLISSGTLTVSDTLMLNAVTVKLSGTGIAKVDSLSLVRDSILDTGKLTAKNFYFGTKTDDFTGTQVTFQINTAATLETTGSIFYPSAEHFFITVGNGKVWVKPTTVLSSVWITDKISNPVSQIDVTGTVTSNLLGLSTFKPLTVNGLPSGTPVSPATALNSVNRVWTITRSAGDVTNLTMKLHWDVADQTIPTNLSNTAKMYFSTGTTWGLGPLGTTDKDLHTFDILNNPLKSGSYGISLNQISMNDNSSLGSQFEELKERFIDAVFGTKEAIIEPQMVAQAQERLAMESMFSQMANRDSLMERNKLFKTDIDIGLEELLAV